MRRNLDLLATVACVAVSLSVFASVNEPGVRVAPALAMVLFLPGYAVSVWLFPAPKLERLERLLLAVGVSISTTVIGALVLDRTAHLTARSWAAGLAAVAVLAAAGGAWRRRHLDVRVAGSPPLRIELGRLLVGLLVATASVTCGVLAVAVARLPAGHAQGSTILWARAESRARGSYELGLESGELGTSRYVLRGELAGEIVLRRTLTLPSGGRWQMTGSVGGFPAGSQLRISLYKASAPTVVYRYVDLTFGT